MRIHYPQREMVAAYTANVSIGQGYDLVSPLQLAMVYATVANGGVSYYPRLVDKVLNRRRHARSERQRRSRPFPQTPRVRADLRYDFSRDQIELARKGLWKVVNEDGGTGGRARLKGVQVAGKTGTAQASDRRSQGHDRLVCLFRSLSIIRNTSWP